MGIVTVMKVDALWWLGRYTERAYTTMQKFFAAYDRTIGRDPERFRYFSDALDLGSDMSDFETFVYDFMYDLDNPNSVASAMQCAFSNAILLRPELGTENLAYIEMALSRFLQSKGDPTKRLNQQRNAGDSILAFWGAVEDSDLPIEIQNFLFGGKYLERLDLRSRFGADPATYEAPLRELEASFASMTDGGRALLREAVLSVADSMERRGAPAEVIDRVRVLTPVAAFDNDGNVVAAGCAVES